MRTGLTILAGVVIVLFAMCVMLKARTDRLKADVERQEQRIVAAIERQPELTQSDRELLDALHAEAEVQRKHAEMARRGQLPPLNGMGVR